jgi:hypothetical protein
MTGQWHPDATALAEYRAALADGRRGRRIAAHIAGCASCASVSDQLAAVTAVLASAPDPALPDAVEHRIMAALAAEAAHAGETSRETKAAPGTVVRSVPGNGSGPRRRPGGAGSRARWLRPAMLAGAVAACLVLFGGVYGIAHLSSGSSSSSAASSAEGSAAAGSASSPMAGAAAPETQQGHEPARSAQQATFLVTSSGTRYQPATLAGQVRAELARSAESATPPTADVAPSAQFAACVLHLTGQVRPSLVDRATYQGKPAYVIAVANWAWVVAPGCSASNPELIASVGL